MALHASAGVSFEITALLDRIISPGKLCRWLGGLLFPAERKRCRDVFAVAVAVASAPA
jgi:hypothetical protein